MREFEAYLKFRGEIEQIVDPALYPMEWVDAQIWSGHFRVFFTDNAIIAVELKPYPSGALELHGMFAAGELSEILDLIENAEAWGRSMGCAFATISSRPGWAKVLNSRGYEVNQVNIRKVL